MRIPTGYWCVVSRRVGTPGKGDIVLSMVTEEHAKREAAKCNQLVRNYNYWAMPRELYDTPFREA